MLLRATRDRGVSALRGWRTAFSSASTQLNAGAGYKMD
jgi:hypothetical protein